MRPQSGDRVRLRFVGFTLVELLVVMGIIVMAAGLMTPALADFFKNRFVDAVRGEFRGVFGRARLKAVTEGLDVSVVFFREGPRIFDDRNGSFADADWSPRTSALANEKNGIWYRLGCADDIASVHPDYEQDKVELVPRPPRIPPYEWWEDKQSKRVKERLAGGVRIRTREFDVRGLAKITFHRDGTLTFGPGMNDVRTTEYRREQPRTADVVVHQDGNPSVYFIDLRPTGQSSSKKVRLTDPVESPMRKNRADTETEGS